MLKTCMNCSEFRPTICNIDDSNDHYHYFCTFWGRLLNAFNYYNSSNIPSGHHFYDDLETGVAECYMYTQTDNPVNPDEWYLENRLYNDKIVEEFKCPDTVECEDCPKQSFCPW